ncbi:prokaryotic DNA topoisomerase [Schistosoma japonicum]|uniref:Prokaryotic DNA topoisomerase n=1 Tax=Schistosoma japonicum TaxID=6182 RepID=A0A4Z2CZS3_SCHJA|nr:prokaryotic DNA topoisomerase [Schistosoma japonicum]
MTCLFTLPRSGKHYKLLPCVYFCVLQFFTWLTFRMLSFKLYPSYIPLYATIHGLFWLVLGYLVAVYYDHVQPFVPFVSALGIYPPEQYMFMCLMGSYGVMMIISQWFWCSMMMKKFRRKSFSIVGQYTCIFVALLYTIAGICIVLLSFFNMKDTNQFHYELSMINFYCHVIVIPLSLLLIICVFRPWKWFLLARILVACQLLLGSYFFVYYNWIGNMVFAGSNFFYIREYEPGYVEFNKCAFSEWLAIFSLLEITLITGLELRNHEIQNEETNHDIYAILAA